MARRLKLTDKGVAALKPRAKRYAVSDPAVPGHWIRGAIKAIKEGLDRAGPQSFASVSEQWLKRHVDAKGLRTAALIRRALDVHVLPQWGSREFTSIRRGDIARLLDDV